jgi:monoamine oxidase
MPPTFLDQGARPYPGGMRRGLDGIGPSDGVSRRSVLNGALTIAGASFLAARSRAGAPRPGWSSDLPRRTGAPHIAIIGAGLAGLTCAYELAARQVPCTVYEANPDRIGGRCWTSRGWAGGQTAEHGGEFIDTVHHSIRRLVGELGLTLDDVKAHPGSGPRPRDRYFLQGAVRRESAVYEGYHLLVQRAARDARQIGSFRFDRAGRAARALDEQTAEEWLEETLGHHHPLLRIATTQYMAEEYGLDPRRLSALTMVMEFAPGGIPSDERFHVRGGNDQIVHGLADRLPRGAVVRDAALTRMVRQPSGRYRLDFAAHPRVMADVVVLAAPFASLRHADLDQAGLSRRKLACIDTLAMGTNAKVLLQLDHRLGHFDPRHHVRWSGDYYDARVDTWDSSAAQPGRTGLLTVYSGGHVGTSYDPRRPHGPAPHRVVRSTLREVNRAVPGLRDGYTGRAWLDAWVDDPYTRGSYAAYGPGQVTRYWGFVGLAEGHVHFAGEHTSMRAQGFLDGAVASGRRVAREVLAGL